MRDQPTAQDAALLDTETYWWHLARLRESRSRAEAAAHARAMAGVAGRRYAVLAGTRGAGDRDPGAWFELAVYLDRLTMALDQDFTWTSGEDGPEDGEERRSWERLAAASTCGEFAVAWQLVGERIKALAAPRADGSPAPLREFTANQVTWAGVAVTCAPW
jgi:hypothetical protein